jgi:hypothetical protein
MGLGKKLALGVVTFIPAIALVIAAWAYFDESAPEGLAVAAVVVSGIVDTGLAAWFIPHVHDNRRLGEGARIVWLALIGFPYMTVAPLYWLLYVLPERPGDREPPSAAPGGAWYRDPWGEAPFRWWDGERWTDWVTGPPEQLR